MKNYYFFDKHNNIMHEQLLVDTALYYAKSFVSPSQPKDKRQKNPPLTSAQLRNFYHEVKHLEDICKNSTQAGVKIEDKFLTIRPLVKMLKSKAAYACPATGRDRKIPLEFKNFIDELIDNIEDWQDFHAFTLCFEAVVGFFYGQGGR